MMYAGSKLGLVKDGGFTKVRNHYTTAASFQVLSKRKTYNVVLNLTLFS